MLPVDGVLPRIVAQLRSGAAAVVRAEPGAGKTTRVPPALLEAGFGEQGEIVVAQPRRIAARMAAARVAYELGEPLGKRCGYQVRFESKVSRETRIRFVTEGLLARRLRDDPQLHGVSVVVLDEVHERHVDTDLCLALVRRLQRERRPDLKVVAMSATMDAEPVARFLDAAVIETEGRAFPVAIEHVERGTDRPLASQVAGALRRLGEEGVDGSVLVFLPGAREIRACAESCRGVASTHGWELVTLHGELAAAEQDRAVTPGSRPKVILSTNVAETSVTIDGVTVVIDSGLVRRPAHDPWSGIPTLTLAKISRASAEQRTGRAGRTAPGRCVRLYSAHDLARRPEFDTPELLRLDLAGAMLDLRAAGLQRADALTWLDAPPDAAVQAADGLLHGLSAIDDDGALTETGRAMLRYPTHPRLARLLVEAQARGVGRLGAGAAALLSERPVRRGPSHHAALADVLADLQDIDERAAHLDRGAVAAVTRVRKQLAGLVGKDARRCDNPEEELCAALLVAYPDRVARAERRPGLPDRVVFASGGDGELTEDSVVTGADLLVALSVEQRQEGTRTRTLVRSAAHIEAEWLLELHGDRLVEETVVELDAERGRVRAEVQTRYDGLLIDATPLRELPERAREVLAEAALRAGPRAFVDPPERYDELLRRGIFLATQRPDLPPIDEAAARRVLASMCERADSFAALRRGDLVGQLLDGLDPTVRAELDRLTPTHVTLAGGRRLAVHYEIDRAPWVQSRLQDFFGSTTGPTIGHVPLVLHLLAPNQRAVQVTTDLASFWSTHYPDLRRQLMRRYPKHAWPEDPLTASPPAPRPPRRRR